MMIRLQYIIIALSVHSVVVHAQFAGGPYVIQTLDINGGGTTSTGGPYSISASTGQAGGVGTITAEPVPAPPLYQFDDGFWSTMADACDEVISGRFYVDASATGANNGTSWADAYQYLQDALAAAVASSCPNKEIWVANGVYKPDQGQSQSPGDRTVSFQLLNNVIIYGGFAGGETDLSQRNIETNLAILSGDLANNDGPNFANNGENSLHVVTGSSTDATAILDGFTITAGNADDAEQYDCCGAGMLILLSGSPTLTDCIFSANRAAQQGGAMWMAANGNPTLTGCKFLANRAEQHGGAMMINGSSPSLTNCVFASNTAGGHGGGMFNNDASGSSLNNCLFYGNSADGYGGAAFNNNTSASSFTNCTLYGNSADVGGGIYNNSSPVVTNCIIWGNTASTSDPQIGESATVTYSCVQGGWPGTCNIGGDLVNHDPRFVDADGADDIVGTIDDNLRLRPASPSIDAGNNAAPGLSGVTIDLAGQLRFMDDLCTLDCQWCPQTTDCGTPPIVDMGAYEFQPDCNSNGVRDCDDPDSDGDGVIDDCDNCPFEINPDQTDRDGDGTGDVCEPVRAITTWRSVRTHSGSCGELGIVLNPSASGNGVAGPTVETRRDVVDQQLVGGIQKIVVDFNDPVALINPAAITVVGRTTDRFTNTMGPAVSYTPSSIGMIDADTLQILFAPGALPDESCYTVDVPPSTIGEILGGDHDVNIRSLVADTNMTGEVNLGDQLSTKNKVASGQPASGNPQHDVNLTCTMNLGDVLLVKSRIASPTRKALCP